MSLMGRIATGVSALAAFCMVVWLTATAVVLILALIGGVQHDLG